MKKGKGKRERIALKNGQKGLKIASFVVINSEKINYLSGIFFFFSKCTIYISEEVLLFSALKI